ncbi:hypothetical protein RIF29_09512 [Crotalaria pallida]|uniref:Uncharacterized protein n=1 Tax=Crotalaria pallida TaxID=3830 RepID=A0AAN9FRV0_CROPI
MDIASFLLATSFIGRIDSTIKVKVGEFVVEIRVMEDPLENLGWDVDPEESISEASDVSVSDDSKTPAVEEWPETPQRRNLDVALDDEDEDTASMVGIPTRTNSERTKDIIQQTLLFDDGRRGIRMDSVESADKNKTALEEETCEVDKKKGNSSDVNNGKMTRMRRDEEDKNRTSDGPVERKSELSETSYNLRGGKGYKGLKRKAKKTSLSKLDICG